MSVRLITLLAFVVLTISACATSSPVQRYSESKSHFSHPPQVMSNQYADKDIYRIYHRASTGFVSIQSIREAAEQRADSFAQRQGKSIVVLGEQISQPPYILGNFPRIEIVFAVVDASQTMVAPSPQRDKYAELEKLKKLLDQGVLTQDEYVHEKAKLLN